MTNRLDRGTRPRPQRQTIGPFPSIFGHECTPVVSVQGGGRTTGTRLVLTVVAVMVRVRTEVGEGGTGVDNISGGQPLSHIVESTGPNQTIPGSCPRY